MSQTLPALTPSVLIMPAWVPSHLHFYFSSYSSFVYNSKAEFGRRVGHLCRQSFLISSSAHMREMEGFEVCHRAVTEIRRGAFCCPFTRMHELRHRLAYLLSN